MQWQDKEVVSPRGRGVPLGEDAYSGKEKKVTHLFTCTRIKPLATAVAQQCTWGKFSREKTRKHSVLQTLAARWLIHSKESTYNAGDHVSEVRSLSWEDLLEEEM